MSSRAAKALALQRQGYSQIANPVKAKIRAAQKRAQKKALIERSILFRQWKVWRKEKEQQLFNGPHCEAARHLIDFLERMTLRDGHKLLDLIKHGPWQHTDENVKFQVLSMIDLYIMRLRHHAKLEPFDDPLPGDPLNVFQTIKEHLNNERFVSFA